MLKKTEAIKNKSNKEIKITAQRNVYAQLLMLVQENDIDLEKLFTFPLGPVPWPLATGDGMLTKTEKAVILHKLEASVTVQTVQTLKEDVHVLEGNVLLHSLQTMLDTFEELARNLFNAFLMSLWYILLQIYTKKYP